MITLDDKYRLEDFGLIAEIGHGNPITPKIENKTIPIPGRAGLWDFGSEIKEKQISLPVACVGEDRITLQQNLNDFVAFLCDEYGKPREMKVVFDYEPDKFYTAKLVGQIEPERIIHLGRFVFDLVANDPYKYSNVTVDEIVWGSTEITYEYNFVFGHESPVYFEITGPKTVYLIVDGLAVQPTFEITGTANNLRIWNDKYEIKLGDFTNESWIINCEKYSVLRNGQETMVDMWDFYLIPGRQPLRFSGTNIDIKINVKYRYKYM